MTGSPLLSTLAIFCSIAFVNLLYAFRLIMIVRGRRLLAVMIGFWEAILFIYIFGNVASDFSRWYLVLAYCLGAACGGDLGILLERYLISGFVKITINTRDEGPLLAAYIREQGFGATENEGTGLLEQPIWVIQTIIPRTYVQALLDFIREKAPDAFITIEEVRSTTHGWLPSSRFFKWSTLGHRE